jgi:hypothetical protein
MFANRERFSSQNFGDSITFLLYQQNDSFSTLRLLSLHLPDAVHGFGCSNKHFATQNKQMYIQLPCLLQLCSL